MTERTTFRTTLVGLLLLAAPLNAQSIGSAEFFFDGTNSKAVETVQVFVTNRATEACWSNAIEAREYAENMLAAKGYQIESEMDWGVWRLNLFVFSHRHFGRCSGFLTIDLSTFGRDYREQTGGILTIGELAYEFVNYKNVNTAVIENLEAAISAFPKR